MSSAEEELERLRQEYDEFVEGSKELEAAMEAEMEQREASLKVAWTDLENAKNDKAVLQERFAEERAEGERLRSEMQALKDEVEELKGQRTRLESENDMLENSSRQAEAAADVLKAKLDEALER